jgi:hypothetical protein
MSFSIPQNWGDQSGGPETDLVQPADVCTRACTRSRRPAPYNRAASSNNSSEEPVRPSPKARAALDH